MFQRFINQILVTFLTVHSGKNGLSQYLLSPCFLKIAPVMQFWLLGQSGIQGLIYNAVVDFRHGIGTTAMVGLQWSTNVY